MPAFSLPNLDGSILASQALTDAPALLVVFMCNHCPYVKHIATELVRLYEDYHGRGLAMVGINSNDTLAYPQDSPEAMIQEAKEQGYQFPYLFDATQQTAIAFHAACTPDFFLFDAQRLLVYRGQLDASRPSSDLPLDGSSLRPAIEAVLAGATVTVPQVPSLGCNIKWAPGNAPKYF